MDAFFSSGAARKATHWVVSCKGCKREIAAGIETAPKDNIIVKCQRCGELRRYRIAEVYRGCPGTS